jgi:hypothetical protein
MVAGGLDTCQCFDMRNCIKQSIVVMDYAMIQQKILLRYFSLHPRMQPSCAAATINAL